MTPESLGTAMRNGWPGSYEELLERARSKTPEQRQRERQERAADQFRKWEEERKLRAAEQCRRLSEMGARFEQRTFANFSGDDGNRDALAAAQEIVDDAARDDLNQRMGGYFWSTEPGIGKTHLAGAIVNECVSRGIPAVFTTGVGLLMRIRDSYNRNGNVKEGEMDIIERLSDVKVLALDDVGTERFTADTGRLLYALINARYEANLGIVITSNLSLATLGKQWAKSGVEEHVGYKIIDRLREMCTFKIELSGVSRRGVAQ